MTSWKYFEYNLCVCSVVKSGGRWLRFSRCYNSLEIGIVWQNYNKKKMRRVTVSLSLFKTHYLIIHPPNPSTM